MNTKTTAARTLLTTLAAVTGLAALLAGPVAAQAATCPDDANDEAWMSRSSFVYVNQNTLNVFETLYLSDASWNAQYIDNTLPGTHEGYLISNHQQVSSFEAGSWIISNGFFVRVNHEQHPQLVGVGHFPRSQIGTYDEATTSVVEGVDLNVNFVNSARELGQTGQFNLGQGYDPGEVDAGVEIALDGCWEFHTDWFDGETLALATQLTPNGEVTGQENEVFYAARQSGSGEKLLVVSFGNGRVVGGRLTDDGNDNLEITQENGVAFAPSLSNQSMLSDLGDDYLTCGPDPRASTFSMTYVGATC